MKGAPLNDERFNRLKYFLKEDGDALVLAVDLIFLGRAVEDTADNDVERSTKDIKRTFKALMIDGKSDNSFLTEHSQQLTPLIALAYMSWLDSMKLNQGENGDKFKALCIKNDCLKVIRYMMLLVGGPEWSEKEGLDFWREFGPSAEDFKDA
jgi:hypothetical protein